MEKNKLPRGIRNNNPANIVRAGYRWLGMCEVQSDDRFCQFTDIKFGVRAFFILARFYRKKYHIRSVYGFINRFAPSCENNVASYVDYIMSNNHFPHGFLRDDLDYSILLYWIIRYENNLSDNAMSFFNLSLSWLDNVRKNFNINIV